MRTTEPLTEGKEAAAAKGQLPRRDMTWLLIGTALLVGISLFLPRLTETPISGRFQTFVTIFLGIFIEAIPFLLIGSVVSGLLEEFVDKNSLAKLVPRRAIPAAFVGSLLGFIFPVCECGVVPVTRRLYQKGMPLSVGIAFLLAAPVVNPVVLISTYVAFGAGPVLYGRFAFTVLIAFAVGLLFSFARPQDVLLPGTQEQPHHDHQHSHSHSLIDRVWNALAIGGDDLLDMSRYLILGSMIAAAMQTFVPQSTLLALGSGPIISIVALMALAFVLSICSTVDAFVALSFAGSFTTGSILAFLVFGPMVDIKSALMFLGVMRRRVVLYLILLPLTLTLLITVFVNLNLGW
ncbi:MAG: permease [Anaerolineae bacterium]|nr:permease [Anaerolineae bacterium]